MPRPSARKVRPCCLRPPLSQWWEAPRRTCRGAQTTAAADARWLPWRPTTKMTPTKVHGSSPLWVGPFVPLVGARPPKHASSRPDQAAPPVVTAAGEEEEGTHRRFAHPPRMVDDSRPKSAIARPNQAAAQSVAQTHREALLPSIRQHSRWEPHFQNASAFGRPQHHGLPTCCSCEHAGRRANDCAWKERIAPQIL